MDHFEESVMSYLCGRPERFISPQFNIPYADFKGGSCPDFVVLDFTTATIYVAEVTIASDSRRVMQRVSERTACWFEPLRIHLQKLNPMFSTWDCHVTVFVRNEELERARTATAMFPDVSVISLDEVAFSWRWKRRADGTPENPLREPTKLARVHAAQQAAAADR
jgi:hypothetical protein